MNKACLLAAVSALAFLAQGSVAAERSGGFVQAGALKGAKTLYSQNSNGNGSYVESDNFTSGVYSSDDTAAADDFVVPKKQKWKVTEVDVTGAFFNGSGPATSENVIFYTDDNGVPGKTVKGGAFLNLKGADNDGSLAITFPKKGLKLKPGTYWVSVVVNCSFIGGCGEWGWEATSTIHGNQAVQKFVSGWNGLGEDLMFAVGGKSKHQ